MSNSAEWPIVPETDFELSQVIENARILEPKKRPPNPSRFKFERVNEVTLKLTNGEATLTPASHGQWAACRTSKAIAWVICVHPGQWLARCRDQACGPEPLNQAKADAVAMAKGRVGCFVFNNPVAHLNEIAALLADREGAE